MSFDYTAFGVSGNVGIPLTGLTTPVKWLSLPPTDRHKSVRNCCVIEVFGGVCVLSSCFLFFCWCRGFCHRTKSDIFLFLSSQFLYYITSLILLQYYSILNHYASNVIFFTKTKKLSFQFVVPTFSVMCGTMRSPNLLNKGQLLNFDLSPILTPVSSLCVCSSQYRQEQDKSSDIEQQPPFHCIESTTVDGCLLKVSGVENLFIWLNRRYSKG